MSRQPLLNVVLFQPEIPQNTGNIGRTCVAVGAKLWLIRPLGYQLDSSHLKRAGLDYWQFLDWEAVDSWEEVRSRLPDSRVWCLTKFGAKNPWEADYQRGDILLFGRESSGLPEDMRNEFADTTIRFPMHPEVRSLNLASTATAVIYEAVRQFGGIE
ncbi:tRNA (cytidine(34)-2'-O)-methyltransferase [Rubinisphaera margarita]|uniref:tRNA (cytidine(34)-2'-O)-methyltransferase n=1 Tax=Rubinisphaera margarita TaxID=2909586 RepID=UPI001EE81968|nr:tRNA (cytidine(34)-2'-O)-methyltransferase [Rubinisphaera margarita]MCG6158399.1 tRNA (cytidine(34)-2'-O)-methyltransferase [Rubinisphaera margarita]